MISLNKIFYGLIILMLVAGMNTYKLMMFKSTDELNTLLLALLCVVYILCWYRVGSNCNCYTGGYGFADSRRDCRNL